MATRMQQRRGTAAQWSTANPILTQGEIGFAFDTGVIKVGDGVKAWNDLASAYIGKAGGDEIQASAPGVVPLSLRAAVGQTANLLVIRDGAGAVIGYIDAAGDLFVKGVQVATLNTAIMKTIVDAKGDLIVATASDTVARLAKGTDGLSLIADSTTPTGLKWGSPESAVPITQTFTVSGTWTKPAGARWVLVECLGGGAGGQGGAQNSSNAPQGGRGGGGGGFIRKLYAALDLPATVPVTVGAGGAGAPRASGATFSYGSPGGNSSFHDATGYGAGGANGNTAHYGGPGGDALYAMPSSFDDSDQNYDGGNGQLGAENSSIAGSGGQNSKYGGGGGGGGGSNSSFNAGPGGGPSDTAGVGAGGAAGTGSLNGPTTAGGNGGYRQGGGGGGSASNTAPKDGGQGGVGGGGGGGGAARTTGYLAGNGGNGGRGEVRVITLF